MISANASKKGAKFTKFAREIQVAAKLGGPEPENNSRLRIAVDKALAESMPKDTIERAIKKGAGLVEGSVIEEVTYEGYGPHQVGVIVECQTDNRNRTASEIRQVFVKKGGGELTPVMWMFDRVGLVEGTPPGGKMDDPEAEAIEAGANEVEQVDDKTYSFLSAPEDLKAVEAALRARGWNITTSELSYKAKSPTELSDDQKKEVVAFIQELDDNDDSSRIHASVSF